MNNIKLNKGLFNKNTREERFIKPNANVSICAERKPYQWLSFTLALGDIYLRVGVGNFGRPIGALARARDDSHDLAAVLWRDLHLEGWSGAGLPAWTASSLSLIEPNEKLNLKLGIKNCSRRSSTWSHPSAITSTSSGEKNLETIEISSFI